MGGQDCLGHAAPTMASGRGSRNFTLHSTTGLALSSSHAEEQHVVLSSPWGLGGGAGAGKPILNCRRAKKGFPATV